MKKIEAIAGCDDVAGIEREPDAEFGIGRDPRPRRHPRQVLGRTEDLARGHVFACIGERELEQGKRLLDPRAVADGRGQRHAVRVQRIERLQVGRLDGEPIRQSRQRHHAMQEAARRLERGPRRWSRFGDRGSQQINRLSDQRQRQHCGTCDQPQGGAGWTGRREPGPDLDGRGSTRCFVISVRLIQGRRCNTVRHDGEFGDGPGFVIGPIDDRRRASPDRNRWLTGKCFGCCAIRSRKGLGFRQCRRCSNRFGDRGIVGLVGLDPIDIRLVQCRQWRNLTFVEHAGHRVRHGIRRRFVDGDLPGIARRIRIGARRRCLAGAYRYSHEDIQRIDIDRRPRRRGGVIVIDNPVHRCGQRRFQHR